MDRNFLWYGVSIVVNDILVSKSIFIDNIKITDLKTEIKDNVFNYTFILNNDYDCSINYKFSSNVAIDGLLTIKCDKYNDTFIYNVERGANNIKVEKDFTSYHELYCYNDKSFIDIVVNNLQKTEIISLNVLSKRTASVQRADITFSRLQNNRFNKPILPVYRTLFAVSGAIDGQNTLCKDIVVIGSNRTNMIVYDSGNFQAICVDNITSVKNDKILGDITITNSDFNQKINYSIVGDICHIVEQMATTIDKKTIRREYDLAFSNNSIIVNKDRFIIKHHNNDVEFVNYNK